MQQAFDAGALARLSDEVGEAEATAFVLTFSDMLDGRLARIDRAHPQDDLEEWHSAVVGLGASAGMAGAQRLEQTCAELLAADPTDMYALDNLKAHLRADGRIFALAIQSFRTP